jgi:hypothetical protein
LLYYNNLLLYDNRLLIDDRSLALMSKSNNNN